MTRSSKDIIREIPFVGDALKETDRYSRNVEVHHHKPTSLYMAELFLFIIIAIYFTKLIVIVMGLASDYGDIAMNILVFIVDVFMLFVTLGAVLGVSSKDPMSWRKVMRGAMLLLLFSIMGTVLNTGTSASALVTLSPVLVGVMSIPISAIMFTRTVREYYLPPFHDMPSLRKWISFSLFGQLFPAEQYEIDY